MRCSNGIPHSPHADFFKFADVVVAEAGLKKLPKAVLEGMEGECWYWVCVGVRVVGDKCMNVNGKGTILAWCGRAHPMGTSSSHCSTLMCDQGHAAVRMTASLLVRVLSAADASMFTVTVT